MNLSLLWLALPFVLGVFLSFQLLAKRHSLADWLLLLLIGLGIGVGLVSVAYFTWSLIFSPDYRLDIFLGLELLITIGLAGLLWRKMRRDMRQGLPWVSSGSFRSSGSIGIESFLLIGLLGIVLFYAASLFVETVQLEPQGNWDAVAIWNFHARFMYLGKAHWMDIFEPLGLSSHPDYPYLLPGFIALCWSILGGAKSNIPPLVGAFFTFGNVALLSVALWRFRDLNQALLASIVLLSASNYIQTGGGLAADIPLSFFVLLICILVIFAFKQEKTSRGALILVGMVIGFILWTKNEGMVFAFAFLISWFSVALWRGEFRKCLQEFMMVLAGGIPFLILILYYKLLITPPDDMLTPIAAQGLSANLTRLTSLARYLETFRWFGIVIWQAGGWRVPLLLVLLSSAVLIGFRQSDAEDSKGSRGEWIVVVALGTVLIGYFFIYILTPHNLANHLHSSASRLFLHLFPSIIMLVFYKMKSIPVLSKIGRRVALQ